MYLQKKKKNNIQDNISNLIINFQTIERVYSLNRCIKVPFVSSNGILMNIYTCAKDGRIREQAILITEGVKNLKWRDRTWN